MYLRTKRLSKKELDNYFLTTDLRRPLEQMMLDINIPLKELKGYVENLGIDSSKLQYSSNNLEFLSLVDRDIESKRRITKYILRNEGKKSREELASQLKVSLKTYDAFKELLTHQSGVVILEKQKPAEVDVKGNLERRELQLKDVQSFIEKNYKTMHRQEIAVELGISYLTVLWWENQLGIQTPVHLYKNDLDLPDEHVRYILDNYLIKTNKEIHVHTGINKNSFNTVRLKMNLRTTKELGDAKTQFIRDVIDIATVQQIVDFLGTTHNYIRTTCKEYDIKLKKFHGYEIGVADASLNLTWKEIKYIKENYRVLPNDMLSYRLGISDYKLVQSASKLGLRTRAQCKQYMKEFYGRKPLEDIQKELGLPDRLFNFLLKESKLID